MTRITQADVGYFSESDAAAGTCPCQVSSCAFAADIRSIPLSCSRSGRPCDHCLTLSHVASRAHIQADVKNLPGAVTACCTDQKQTSVPNQIIHDKAGSHGLHCQVGMQDQGFQWSRVAFPNPDVMSLIGGDKTGYNIAQCNNIVLRGSTALPSQQAVWAEGNSTRPTTPDALKVRTPTRTQRIDLHTASALEASLLGLKAGVCHAQASDA